MFILAMYEKVFKKNIPAILFGAVLLIFNISNVYGEVVFHGGQEFQVNTYINDYQQWPFVTVLNDGNFVVVWDSRNQDGSGLGIYGQIFDEAGVKIGSEFRVNAYTANDQRTASVTKLNNGNFVVVWASDGQDGSSYGAYAQIFDANANKIGNEFRVNAYVTHVQDPSAVVTLSNGNFVATWHSYNQDGSDFGIYAQIFDETGAKVGGEFQVNTYTNNKQTYPFAATFVNGNFVIYRRA